jgi:hypothetical protein
MDKKLLLDLCNEQNFQRIERKDRKRIGDKRQWKGSRVLDHTIEI